MTIAVLLLRRGSVPTEAQQRACLDYVARHQYRIDSVCFHPADAAAAIEGGHATVIIAAYRRSEDRAIRARVRHAGGRIEYTRTPPTSRPVGAEDLAVALHERGASIEVIAELLGESTQNIALTLSGQPPERRREPAPDA